jgi:tetratricopeptide (TPR) repeat protein
MDSSRYSGEAEEEVVTTRQMRRKLAEWFNERGRLSDDAGQKRRSKHFYKLASILDPGWSVPWYNLGLLTKYAGFWEDSIRFNRRALELNPADEAAWWNLGIAATALRYWDEARRAWRNCGIELNEGSGEVLMPPVTACVRLNPQGSGEVVWGQRLDPARLLVLNIPLPDSKHRFHDIVLNDGASNGTRVTNGVEVPVFDELAIWQPSRWSTFRASVRIPDESAEEKLTEFCEASKIGIEDWSSIRIICAECSRGNPGPHDCKAVEPEGARKTFGFAAQSSAEVFDMLREWKAVVEGAEFRDVETVFAANPN